MGCMNGTQQRDSIGRFGPTFLSEPTLDLGPGFEGWASRTRTLSAVPIGGVVTFKAGDTDRTGIVVEKSARPGRRFVQSGDEIVEVAHDAAAGGLTVTASASELASRTRLSTAAHRDGVVEYKWATGPDGLGPALHLASCISAQMSEGTPVPPNRALTAYIVDIEGTGSPVCRCIADAADPQDEAAAA